MVSAAVLTGINVSADPTPAIIGPLTFNWTLTTAKLIDSPKYPAPGKSTATGSGFNRTTNIVQVFTDSDTTTPGFGDASLLALLANSFNMTFPAGTKLMTDGGVNVYVVDHTGKNVLVDVSPVLKVTVANQILSGVETDTTAIKFSSTNTTHVQTHSGSEFVTINYDDSAQTTADGTKSVFQLFGISSSSNKNTETVTTNDVVKASRSFVVHGFGSGTFRGQNHLIQGTITGSASGTEVIPQ